MSREPVTWVEREQLGELAAQINREHRACQEAATSALTHAMAAGDGLIEAKALCEHGNWKDWLDDNCHASYRTAVLYMRVASHRALLEANMQRVAHLSLRQAQILLAEQRPESRILEPKQEVWFDRAYCKYCYTTHSKWQSNEDGAYVCGQCNHATHGDYMSIRDDEPEGERIGPEVEETYKVPMTETSLTSIDIRPQLELRRQRDIEQADKLMTTAAQVLGLDDRDLRRRQANAILIAIGYAKVLTRQAPGAIVSDAIGTDDTSATDELRSFVNEMMIWAPAVARVLAGESDQPIRLVSARE